MKKVWAAVLAASLLMSTVSGAAIIEAKSWKNEHVHQNFAKDQDLSKLENLFSSENFKAMDGILPYNRIETDGGRKEYKVKPTKKDLMKLEYKFNGEKHKLEELLSKTNTGGILVLKKDKIEFEKYFNGYNQESTVTSWSVAKSFISSLVGIAVDEKKINSIDDQVTKYVPELKGSGYDGVTVKQVLEMSSGVKFNEDYTDLDSDLNQMIGYLFVEGGSVDEYVKGLVRESKPGTHKYKSVDTQVLGLILKKATGMPVSKYLEEKIWKPMGATHDAYWNTDLSGNEISFALLNSNMRDFAKYGQLMMNDGKYKGTQIVPKKWVQEAVKPNRPELAPGKADPYFGYGYQWWIPNGAKYGEEFSAIGIYGQYIYVNKKYDIVIVKSSCDPMVIENDAETIEAFRQISKSL